MPDERSEDELAEESRNTGDWTGNPSDDPEAPEADAQEQRQPVAGVGHGEPDLDDPEVPEADALEQASVVEDDDDYEG